MSVLHTFLIFILIFSSFLVFFSSNPIHSVLFLILTFCNAATVLFLFNVDFLGVLFIIIYVGAIAVLFLFVVMMLNIKIKPLNNILYTPVFFFFSIIICIHLYLNLNNIFFDKNTKNFLYLLDDLSNIDVFGQTLYNYFIVCFLIAGLILLLSMIGAIILTFKFYSFKRAENFNKQLSRSDNFLSFFK